MCGVPSRGLKPTLKNPGSSTGLVHVSDGNGQRYDATTSSDSPVCPCIYSSFTQTHLSLLVFTPLSLRLTCLSLYLLVFHSDSPVCPCIYSSFTQTHLSVLVFTPLSLRLTCLSLYLLNIEVVLNETNTDVRMYTC